MALRFNSCELAWNNQVIPLTRAYRSLISPCSFFFLFLKATKHLSALEAARQF